MTARTKDVLTDPNRIVRDSEGCVMLGMCRNTYKRLFKDGRVKRSWITEKIGGVRYGELLELIAKAPTGPSPEPKQFVANPPKHRRPNRAEDSFDKGEPEAIRAKRARP
jgi:hypothetical protein